nr:MAG TPA: hypothetical protein [Caudoviricetes sp.]
MILLSPGHRVKCQSLYRLFFIAIFYRRKAERSLKGHD